MWSISPPVVSAADTFKLCVVSLRDGELRDRLERLTRLVAIADYDYRAAGVTGSLHELDSRDFAMGDIKIAEMATLYDGKFAASRGSAREVYDAIKLAARDGLCPMCRHGVVTSLDHFLPKGKVSSSSC